MSEEDKKRVSDQLTALADRLRDVQREAEAVRGNFGTSSRSPELTAVLNMVNREIREAADAMTAASSFALRA